MWLLTPRASYSVAQDEDDAGTLIVSAQATSDLRALAGDDCTVEETSIAEYPFRVRLPRVGLAALLKRLLDEIDYGDDLFGAVSEMQGKEAADLYELAWSLAGSARLSEGEGDASATLNAVSNPGLTGVRRKYEPRLYGASEAAAVCGVMPSNLRRLVGLPEPYARLRCGTLWRADEIDHFAKARFLAPAAEATTDTTDHADSTEADAAGDQHDQPRTARRSDWQNEPMSSGHVLAYDRSFTAEQTAYLRQGSVPSEMEDHWFVFMEGDLLHVHRSWTGYEMFQVRLVATDDGGSRVDEVRVNDEHFNLGDEEAAIKRLATLLGRLAGTESDTDCVLSPPAQDAVRRASAERAQARGGGEVYAEAGEVVIPEVLALPVAVNPHR
ncbi:MAG TPA: hypothetical protein PKB03_09765, partial [Baekduia sp.]|nr:hypothetical protein [Baekduia sp.]